MEMSSLFSHSSLKCPPQMSPPCQNRSPLDETIVGKKYSAGPFLVERRDAIYYALACGDDNPSYFVPDGNRNIVVPPMFAARYARTPVDPMKRDPTNGLDLEHLVHYSQEFHWLAPVHPGDRVFAQGTISHVSIRENGAVLGFGILATNQEGRAVVRATWELFDKSAGRAGTGKPSLEPDQDGALVGEGTRCVSPIQPYVYAEASGDRNPIHIDHDYARQAGLPGPILHGMCTMAFTHRFAVQSLCGKERNPLRMKRLRVQFSRPVLPGDTLTFTCRAIGSQPDGDRYGIRAVNQLGKPVLRNAWCVVA